MKCLILAAGYATRLYPLTENFPKPLLDVGGKTILDWLVDDIDTAGVIDEYLVISNHRYAHHFEKWAAGKTVKITVVDDGTSTNETRLGAVKDIQFAVETRRLTDDLLILAGDNVLDFSLTYFIDYVRQKKTSCVMRYYEPDGKKLLSCGVLTVGEDDRVTAMTEKSPTPATHWCCPPFYYYTHEDVCRIPDAIADGCGTDAPGSYVAWLCSRSPVHAFEMPGKRFDIGNLESYRKVCESYKGIGEQ